MSQDRSNKTSTEDIAHDRWNSLRLALERTIKLYSQTIA